MIEIQKLQDMAGKENVKEAEPMREHTTFRIGGPAKIYVTPQTIKDFVRLITYLKKEGELYFVMGNGSNLLVADEGFAGVVIAARGKGTAKKSGEKTPAATLEPFAETTGGIGEKTPIDVCEVFAATDKRAKDFAEVLPEPLPAEKTLIFAGTGLLLSALAETAAKHSLAGLSFAAGIPGTLGGAITMNAGAYGGQISDCILGAMLCLPDGKTRYFPREELKLGYRTSVIGKKNLIVLWALFALDTGDREQIEEQMQEFNRQRRKKQPLTVPSAGSTFKRPEGYFAGKLIEDAGLKGYREGDVMVSEKHCGFVVNAGEGTCKDALAVIKKVQETVLEKYGVWLETEVKFLR